MTIELQDRLRVLVAPSGFKESLDADQAADCIAAGVLRAVPDAKIIKAPLVDGGEGFTKVLVKATGGVLHHLPVMGPVGRPVDAHFGFLGEGTVRTAVLEMAAAAGLRLVPRNVRDPSATTTRGVGELIMAALDAGAERILIGCGDSGTSDGGAGMAQALGARLLDADGAELGPGGGALVRLDRIDLAGLDPRLDRVRIDVACNWHNVLCGDHGVARVFGPQKGATPEQVENLSSALDHYAAVIRRDLGVDVRQQPGSGASGGLGAALSALIGAKLHSRYDIVMDYLDIEAHLSNADLVFTAEGGIDFQTPRGKIPVEVAMRAGRHGLPVIALSGSVGKNARDNYDHGIDAYVSMLQVPCTLEEAIAQAEELLTDCAEGAMRMVGVGQTLRTAGSLS